MRLPAQTLKLGVLATLSGAGTAWGMAMQGAAELAAEDVNSKGGLEVGGKKYKIEIVAYDDHYKAADALTAINRLIFDDSIKFVVGPLGSAPALAVLPVTHREQGHHDDDGVHAEGAVARTTSTASVP